MNVPGWLKDAIATPRGFIGKKGEMLKVQRMTAKECDEWNNRNKEEAPKTITLDVSTPVPVVTQEEVSVVVAEEPEVAPVAEEVDLSSMTKKELVALAKERGIDLPKGNITKAKVLELLS